MWGVSRWKENTRHPVTGDIKIKQNRDYKKDKAAFVIYEVVLIDVMASSTEKKSRNTPLFLHAKEDFPVIQLAVTIRVFVYLQNS